MNYKTYLLCLLTLSVSTTLLPTDITFSPDSSIVAWKSGTGNYNDEAQIATITVFNKMYNFNQVQQVSSKVKPPKKLTYLGSYSPAKTCTGNICSNVRTINYLYGKATK